MANKSKKAPDNPGFNALPEYVQDKIMENMEYGGEVPMMMASGGGIPERYKKMGFTRVGQKKAGDGKHKWKVLAKKGDKYKVVQGGWKGMQDYSQHGSEKRRSNFWNRMGGKNSAKAKDPFSPLYWHKRLGKWEEGGEVPDNPGFNALPEEVQKKIIANMEAGGKMPADYARARFEAAGNAHLLDEYGYMYGGMVPPMEAGGKMPQAYAEARFKAAGNKDMLSEYGYEQAKYGADIEPFVYNGYNDNSGNWKDPGLKKNWAAQAGMSAKQAMEYCYQCGGMVKAQDAAVIRAATNPGLINKLCGQALVKDESRDVTGGKGGGMSAAAASQNLKSYYQDWKMMGQPFEYYGLMEADKGMRRAYGASKDSLMSARPELFQGEFTDEATGKARVGPEDKYNMAYKLTNLARTNPKGQYAKRYLQQFGRNPSDLTVEQVATDLNTYGWQPAATWWTQGGMQDMQRFVPKKMYGGDVMPEAKSGIYIKPSKRGTFTAAAKKRGMGVQEFASKVMANKEDYSSAMVKKANFARNAAKWKKGQASAVVDPSELQARMGMLGQEELDTNGQPITTPSSTEMQDFTLGYPYSQGVTEQEALDLGAPMRPTSLQSALRPMQANPISPVSSPAQTLGSTLKMEAQQITEDEKTDLAKTKGKRKKGFNILPALTVASAIAENLRPKPKLNIQRQMAYYNPYSTGTGSQAISQSGGVYISGSGIKMAQEGLQTSDRERQQAALRAARELAKYKSSAIRGKGKDAYAPMYAPSEEEQAEYDAYLNNTINQAIDEGLQWYGERSKVEDKNISKIAKKRYKTLEKIKKDPSSMFYKVNPEDLEKSKRLAFTSPSPVGIGVPGYLQEESLAPYVLQHELDHVLQLYAPNRIKSGFFRKGTAEPGELGLNPVYENWMTNPLEQMAIKTELRRNLDPSKVYSPEETAELMKMYENMPEYKGSPGGFPKTKEEAEAMKQNTGPYQMLDLWRYYKKDPKKMAEFINKTVKTEMPVAEEQEIMAKAGQMIKRKDGSYSRRGLWDNIRANRGSGRKPTAEMLRQERKIKAKEAEAGMTLDNLYYPRGGEIMNVGTPEMPIARMGGNIRQNYVSEYEQGGELELFDDRAGAQPIGDNPYSPGPIVKFTPEDAKHRDTEPSGIKMAWKGTMVEAEGDETGRRNRDGNFVIDGNMYNPLTGNKFKKDMQLIAQATEKAKSKMAKGGEMVNNSDPTNPFSKLSFNTGRAKMMGGDMELKNLSAAEEYFDIIQQGKLAYAEELGIEPMRLDKKNKNVKIAKMGANVKAQASAVTPDWMKTMGVDAYNMSVDPALEEVPMSQPTPPPPSSSYYSEWLRNQSLSGFAGEPGQPPSAQPLSSQQESSLYSYLENYANPKRPEATKVKFNIGNVMPEAYALLTNQLEPTAMQKYTPSLKQTYNVSFRNRLAENDKNYRTALRMAKTPAQQAEVFSRKMEMDNKVLGDEFMTNQAIEAQTISGNVDIMNQAQMANLQMAKRQFDEATKARAATRKRTFDALQSIATKKLLSEKGLNELAVLENMYDFRYGPNYRAYYAGQDPYINIPMQTRYDPNTGRYYVKDPNTGREMEVAAPTKTAIGQGPTWAESKIPKQKAGSTIIRDFKKKGYM